MEASRYSAIQDGVLLFREQTKYARDQENLNNDIDLANNIALLKQDSDVKELLRICEQQGVEPQSYAHILCDLGSQLEQNDTAGIEQKQLLAAYLRIVYPGLAPDVSNATDVSNEREESTKKNDLFFAPENLEFRSRKYYKPLSRRRKEIRLVSLRAGKRNQEIKCTLMDPISLADIQSELLDPMLPTDKKHPPYAALSYSAGDLTKTVKIHINDVEFEVYETLERALKRIRHKQYAVHIWIDQISINQHDLAEKAWQVSIMRDIYSCARKTLVSLDVRDHDASAAGFKKFFLMVYDRASSSVIHGPVNTSITGMLGKHLAPGSAEYMEKFRPVQSQQREIAQWLASILLRAEYLLSLRFLVAMYSVPWWHRSWVYQELIVSRDVMLLCGDEEINWSAFQVFNRLIKDAASFLQQSPHDPNFFALGSKSQYGLASVVLRGLTVNQPAIAQLGRVRESLMVFGECDLRWLLSIWRDLESTDPRDKVYAAVGIAKSRYRIVPEYTANNTMIKLLVEVVKRIVSVDGKLDIILDGGESKRHTEWNLPSWVPDFTVPTPRKFPTIAPQSRDPRFDNSKSQGGPSPYAEYVFRAMDDLPARFQFLSNDVTLLNNSLTSSASGIPLLLRIELVRRWSLQTHELGIVGNLPRSQSIHDSWYRLFCEKPKAYTTAQDNHPRSAPYPYTDGENLNVAYLQTVHFYPDIDAVRGAMDYEKKQSNPMSMTQLQLGARDDAERVLMKGREAQRSGNWRFFCTDDLVMGMVPADTRAGDWICFAGGTSVPFVLRPYHGPEVRERNNNDDESRIKADTKPSKATVVGAAYVHGYMFGRAAGELTREVTKTEWADLY